MRHVKLLPLLANGFYEKPVSFESKNNYYYYSYKQSSKMFPNQLGLLPATEFDLADLLRKLESKDFAGVELFSQLLHR